MYTRSSSQIHFQFHPRSRSTNPRSYEIHIQKHTLQSNKKTPLKHQGCAWHYQQGPSDDDYSGKLLGEKRRLQPFSGESPWGEEKALALLG